MQIALLALSLSALALAPEPASFSRQEPSRAATVPQSIKAANEKLIAQMQGAWRLDELTTPSQSADLRREVGFCLISGKYLSLELHLGWIGENSQIDQKDFQSGIFRFEIKEGGLIQTSTVIGSFMNPQGQLQFERPNVERHYQVEIVADRMSLRRNDGQKLTFVRLHDDRLRREANASAKGEPEAKKDKESDR